MVTLLVISMLAYAESEDKILEQVEATNQAIDLEIEKTLEKTSLILQKLETIKQEKPDRYEAAYEKANAKIDDLIEKLINKTNQMAEKMIQKAEKQGYVVLCELKPVEINGKIVMIDPLRVFSIHH